MEDLIPLVAIFCIFGLPVLAFVIIRAMQHRERIELIRRGMHPAQAGSWRDVPPVAPRAQRVGPIDGDDPQRSLRKGIVLAFIGFALTIGLSFIGFLVAPGRGFTPGPWLLGGLIPMFVGLAQIVTAILFGATLPIADRARFGPGPQPGAMPPPPPNFEGSYTYRPDPSTPELGRSAPPDHR